ncbi:hypothetical protein [Streptomyces kebangsaanensis]|uniref:hypothetical protein n=1 Tax=Streptomyces kebangsaanensis TaxID=864058 RepID=UPI00116110B6|nr:hypothetical protein [Streptomyces kebangsaanensis]
MDSAKDVISHQAVANILNGRNFPAWPKVEVLVAALHFLADSGPDRSEMDRIRELWLAAHYEEGAAPSVGFISSSSIDASSPPDQSSRVAARDPSSETDPSVTCSPEESPGEDCEAENMADEGLSVTRTEDERADVDYEEMRVRFVSGASSGPAMFSLDLMAGMLQVIVNSQHPLGASMARVMERDDDEASRLVKLMLISWARMEDEIPTERMRSRIADIRNDWGRYARWLEEPND